MTSVRARYLLTLLASTDLLPEGFCSLPGTAESATLVRYVGIHRLERRGSVGSPEVKRRYTSYRVELLRGLLRLLVYEPRKCLIDIWQNHDERGLNLAAAR